MVIPGVVSSQVELSAACEALLSVYSRTAGSDSERLLQAYRLYTEGQPVPRITRDRPLSGAPDPNFMRALSRQVPERLSHGLRRAIREDGSMIAEMDGCMVTVPPDAVVQNDKDPSSISVKTWAFSFGPLKSFVMLGSPLTPSRELSRIYLNTSPRQALMIVGDLCAQLEATRTRYLAKTLTNPREYYRTDSTIVYVACSDLYPTLDLISDFIVSRNLFLAPRTPLLTCSVGRGVGFADDPGELRTPHGNGSPMSYGQWVATWLRDGVSCSKTPKDATCAVRDAIQSVGRNPDSPYSRPR